MGADTAQHAGEANVVRTPMVAAIAMRERTFWKGLAFAAVVHAALLVGFIRSPPKMMGEASGLADGISVEIVEAPDPNSKNTFAEDGGQAAPQGTLKSAPKPPPPQKQAAAEPQRQPPPPAGDPATRLDQAKPPQESASAPAPPKADPWATAVDALEPAKPPAEASPPAKSAPAKKQQPAEQAPPPGPKPPEPKSQQKLSLQFDLPALTLAPGTRGAAVTRPAGVTRSGENDEFGRGVIRALRKTMPASDVLGRVTVRLLLSQTGNLVEVQLIGGAKDPILNQNVVFAVKQASFPFPPAGATEVDRTFMVTYVYH